MREESLLFIVSQPRSGSTYLQNLLSNTDEVNTTSEHWTLLNFTSFLKPELLKGTFDQELATNAFKEYLLKFPEITFNKKLKEFICSLYEVQLKGSHIIIDKTPRYWEILDEIVKLFPESKIIILKRNPVDVLKSIIKTWNIDSIEKLVNYRRDIFLAIHKLDNFIKREQNNSNLLVVEYEVLKAETSNELKKITKWMGIEYRESMMNTHTNEKIQGKYGDPFQSPKQQKEFTKDKANSFVINSELQNFIREYELFISKDLSSDSLKDLEQFKNILNFLSLDGLSNNLKDQKELICELQKRNNSLVIENNNLINSKSYKIGKKIVAAFQFLKKSKSK